jgi:S1-C subfamily serine protease
VTFKIQAINKLLEGVMMKKTLMLIFILLLFSTSLSAISLPEKPPNIIGQTAQKDKAAVVYINSIVTATAVIPSFTLVEGTTGGTGSIVGTWQLSTNNGVDTLTFSADGTFFGTYPPTTPQYSGTYTTQGNTLILREIIPFRQTIQFTFSVSDGTITLSNPQTGTVTYTRVGAGSTSAVDVVTIAENLEFVKETGTGAKNLKAELMTGVAGTGFIVSSDGYIITNAHMVLAGENTTEMLLQELANSFANELYTEESQYYNIPAAQRDKVVQILLQKFMTYFLEWGEMKDVTLNYYVLNGVASPGEDLKIKSWPAVVKKQGTVYEKIAGEYTWGRDIAIIKVERTNLPTVTLGDSDKVQVGDSVFIIGYPATEAEELFKPASALEATITQGVISARRTLRTGVEAIQTDAAINHGNSGGPVYNDKGEVIGIATFGAGPETGIEAIKFMMPINLAKEFMKELNVENKHSVLDTKYAEGLNAFWNRDCYTAEAKMKDVIAIYPGHPYAQEYVTECERAIQAGEISKPWDLGQIGLIIAGIIGVVVVVVIIIVVAFFFIRRKPPATPKEDNPKQSGKS